LNAPGGWEHYLRELAGAMRAGAFPGPAEFARLVAKYDFVVPEDPALALRSDAAGHRRRPAPGDGTIPILRNRSGAPRGRRGVEPCPLPVPSRTAGDRPLGGGVAVRPVPRCRRIGTRSARAAPCGGRAERRPRAP